MGAEPPELIYVLGSCEPGTTVASLVRRGIATHERQNLLIKACRRVVAEGGAGGGEGGEGGHHAASQPSPIEVCQSDEDGSWGGWPSHTPAGQPYVRLLAERMHPGDVPDQAGLLEAFMQKEGRAVRCFAVV